MMHQHVPIAARLEDARRQRTTGLGFNAIIQGSRPSSAVSSAGKAKYSFPHEEKDLGYTGVVERADSVDFDKIAFGENGENYELRNSRPPNKDNLRYSGTGAVVSGPGKHMPNGRMIIPSAGKAQDGERRGQLCKGLDSASASSPTRPLGSGPVIGGPPFGPPLGPLQGASIQGKGLGGSRPSSASKAAEYALRARQAALADKMAGSERKASKGDPASELVMQGASMTLSPQRNGATTTGGHVLQEVLREKESEVAHLSSLLQREVLEKRSIASRYSKLAHENVNLREEIEQLRTRQRPWSASSAGSVRHQMLQHRTASSNREEAHNHTLLTIQERALPLDAARHAAEEHEHGKQRPASASQGGRSRLQAAAPCVFGQDSLVHRSVYAPKPSSESAVQAVLARAALASASPPKDELLLRPQAYRCLKGPVLQGGQRSSTARQRPQSANAAMRQGSARPGSAGSEGSRYHLQQRPGSARPYSSAYGGERRGGRVPLTKFEEDEGLWPLQVEQRTQRLIDVLAFMRGAAGQKHIRVMDFMTAFDRLKRGHISCSEFRRALESCGCFGPMSESDYDMVCTCFMHEGSTHVRKTDGAVVNINLNPACRVSYSAFCEVLQPVGDKRVKLSVDQQVLKDLGKHKQSPALRGPIELPLEDEGRFHKLVSRILQHTRTARMPVRDFLQRVGAACRGEGWRLYSGEGPGLCSSMHNGAGGNARGVCANGSHKAGCISRSECFQGLQNCDIGMTFGEEDLLLLFRKYDHDGDFNFHRFCRDMEIAERN